MVSSTGYKCLIGGGLFHPSRSHDLLEREIFFPYLYFPVKNFYYVLIFSKYLLATDIMLSHDACPLWTGVFYPPKGREIQLDMISSS